jgi:SAM-dependent methyltransferase
MWRIGSKWPLFLACVGMSLTPASFSKDAQTRESCEQKFALGSTQPGKDVIWLPTDDELVRRMLELAKTRPSDKVYDLGAGDGKIAIAAAKQFGATSVGVEYNPQLVALAQCFAQVEGVSDKVRIVQGDIFETDFSSATVVTMYLLPELNLRLRPTLLDMAPGTRVVSHAFLMGDWEPDAQATGQGSAYLWIVPANVAGTWTFREIGGEEAFTLNLDQKFQKLTGTVGADQPLKDAKLAGLKLTVTFEQQGTPVKLSGEFKNQRIEAVVTRGSKNKKFTGTRS